MPSRARTGSSLSVSVVARRVDPVKPESVVRRRAERLRDRYLRRHVLRSQERLPENCAHSREVLPNKLPYSRTDLLTELDLAPRVVTTLLVIQEDKPVRICMRGADDPSSWSGDICGADGRACCRDHFVPVKTAATVAEEFMKSLEDDKFVYDNFRDLAALQWALGDRRPRLPWYRRLVVYLVGRFIPPVPKLPAPAAEAVDKELESIWRD